MRAPRTPRPGRGVAAVLVALLASAAPRTQPASSRSVDDTLPERLSDHAFWALVEDLSEPDGQFQSDNLVGNERPLQQVVPALASLPHGGAYLGVAPDQNFTYIVALEPNIAFIVDIRRGNLLEHLMYKAVIELSPTRADFLSFLFGRRRPAGLSETTTVRDLIEAYRTAPPDEGLHATGLAAITRHLTQAHAYPLTGDDVAGIAGIYDTFFRYGPSLRYFPEGSTARNMPSYADLMVSTDREGQARSYLASEAHYRFLRDFQMRNLVVPVVGDFAGPKALRAVGAYLAAHRAVVRAFYTSNVEQYLFRSAVAARFYRNVGGLPTDERSVFIRSVHGRTTVLDPIRPLLRAFEAGGIQLYIDITGRGQP